jgi:hypothetical protein
MERVTINSISVNPVAVRLFMSRTLAISFLLAAGTRLAAGCSG